MRNERPLGSNSEEGISLNQALKLLSELRSRVEKLELEVFPFASDNLAAQPQKRRMGRKPKLNTGILLQRRIRLTAWLEMNWPRLSVPLRKAEASGYATEAMAALCAAEKDRFYSPHHPPFYNSPAEFMGALEEFLRSGRYHGNPRNLAGAMSGLPELSWKRSFDICSAHPYKTDHKVPAYWDHMRRNFPDRLRELEEAATELDVKIVLARSRTDDPLYLHMKNNPAKVKEWLNEGKPT